MTTSDQIWPAAKLWTQTGWDCPANIFRNYFLSLLLSFVVVVIWKAWPDCCETRGWGMLISPPVITRGLRPDQGKPSITALLPTEHWALTVRSASTDNHHRSQGEHSLYLIGVEIIDSQINCCTLSPLNINKFINFTFQVTIDTYV